uniref:TIR domain-containing protein n=1 Tax=Candidatus Kentrum sp. TUN TaxID=2126343 RepID=A0A450ZY53_9GAMM|nr:MAG: TIR domain-containing protein [Candidatus Kentron sp. TUN]
MVPREMAKSTITLSYTGKAKEPIEWSTFLRIFDAIWGAEARTLPKFPEVIGGVHAYWRGGNNITYEAESIDELGIAYQKKQTAYIFIADLTTNPSSTFHYWPAGAKVSYKITAKDKATAENYIDTIKKEFPLTEGYDVFLSYSSNDSALAEELKNGIQNQGLKCFMASKDISVGSKWSKEIRTALIESKCTLMLLTSRSYKEPWVMIETGAAWVLEKDIIPALVQVEPKDLIAPLRDYQASTIETDVQKKDLFKELVIKYRRI